STALRKMLTLLRIMGRLQHPVQLMILDGQKAVRPLPASRGCRVRGHIEEETSMKKLSVVAVAAYGIASTMPAIASEREMTAGDPASLRLQSDFDHIGAEVHALTKDDRTSYYIDEGDSDDRAVVFIGGQGTSLEAFQLTEFARTMRQELGLRIVSVERNGFGESEFDPDLGYGDYVEEVLAVAALLGGGKVAVMAIPGGGASAARLAAAGPGPILSRHAGAAMPTTLPARTEPDCSRSAEEWEERLSAYSEKRKD